MQSVLSPGLDKETFSTPPSSPIVADILDRPSLSRRGSRPTNLRISQSTSAQWKPDVDIVQHSPNPSTTNGKVLTPMTATPHINGKPLNGNAIGPAVLCPGNVVASQAPLSPAVAPNATQPSGTVAGKSPRLHLQSPRQPSPMRSPCFVHSQLQGPSFTEWSKGKQQGLRQEVRMDGPQQVDPVHAIQETAREMASPDGTHPHHQYEDEEEEETAGSVTKQLAETAVGVREMSKQLGRTRVHSHIQSVLIVTKARDNRLIKLTRELALYLMLKPRQKGGRGMIVYVDAQLKTSRRFDAARMEKEHPGLFVPVPRRRTSSSSSLASMTSPSTNGHDHGSLMPEGQLRYWTADMCSHSPHLFDFVVTLGGDGTVLFTSWLFQRIVPPVLPFALGSLGFLTNFDFADHQPVMDSAIDAGIRVNLRMRFTCTVYRAVAPEPGKGRRAVKKGATGEILMKNVEKGGWEALESGHAGLDKPCGKDKEIMCFTTRPVESFEVLNDLVVDRGPSPYVSLLELFGDEQHLTTVQADGLTISTPTGSTAYSLSAGGSLVHPEIPAILITPICPHTLSFRPMLLPDSMELRVCVPFNSRSTAWASFDGRGRIELKQGDHIKITASKYPFPTVCSVSQSTDWFQSIGRTLKWNERERQKSFVVVEESPVNKHKRREASVSDNEKGEDETLEDEEEDEVSDGDEEQEEEEKYDIDDLSSTESSNKSTPDKTSPAAHEDKFDSSSSDISHEKALEARVDKDKEDQRAHEAARALAKGTSILRHYNRSRSRSSGLRSGVETPDRFNGPHPHPPRLSPRHVAFAREAEVTSSSSSASLAAVPMDRDSTVRNGERGARDDLHSPRSHLGARSRIPLDRDVEADTLRTPTAFETSSSSRARSPNNVRRRRSRERATQMSFDGDLHPRRAFAVWGQDESDSATSDSDY
ncbi:hypothetical protein BC835DRAFT_536729 [Cytidiella melzeri]|nr:hypothetical protein BC835DRAFT_536729 [Cytidiella melzeri]